MSEDAKDMAFDNMDHKTWDWMDYLNIKYDGHARGVFLDAGLCVKCDETWPCSTVRLKVTP